MIKVNMWETSIEVIGHANKDVNGGTEVCAAISALNIVYKHFLTLAGLGDNTHIQDGYAKFHWLTSIRQTELEFFEAMEETIMDIQQAYPEHIKVSDYR